MSELAKVMIYRKSTRVLEAACWSCRASDTYCDGRYARRGVDCCPACGDCDVHDAHTGLPHDGHDEGQQ